MKKILNIIIESSNLFAMWTQEKSETKHVVTESQTKTPQILRAPLCQLLQTQRLTKENSKAYALLHGLGKTSCTHQHIYFYSFSYHALSPSLSTHLTYASLLSLLSPLSSLLSQLVFLSAPEVSFSSGFLLFSFIPMILYLVDYVLKLVSKMEAKRFLKSQLCFSIASDFHM